MPATLQWALLARILRPQGRVGEVLADLFTDFPERFQSHPNVLLADRGFSDLETGIQSQSPAPQPALITAHWLPVGRNAGRVVLHFDGVDSIAAADQLSGKEVVVPAEARMPLEADATYISDLVGCTVYDGTEALGTVLDVEFPASPDGLRRLEQPAPLLNVEGPSGEEMLIPFAKQYLVRVDIQAREIRMQLPHGLTRINAQDS